MTETYQCSSEAGSDISEVRVQAVEKYVARQMEFRENL